MSKKPDTNSEANTKMKGEQAWYVVCASVLKGLRRRER